MVVFLEGGGGEGGRNLDGIVGILFCFITKIKQQKPATLNKN